MRVAISGLALSVLHWVVVGSGAWAGEAEHSDIAPATDDQYLIIASLFEYQPEASQLAFSLGQDEYGSILAEKIILTGSAGRPFPVLLALPDSASPPFPCVLLLGGLTWPKESWLLWSEHSTMTRSLLMAGIAVLAMETPGHGERSWELGYQLPAVVRQGRGEVFRDIVIEGARDARRCLDYLASRHDVDAERLGVMGASLGGYEALPVAATDNRVKVLVLAGVGPNPGKEVRAVAPQHFAPRITEPAALMLIGTQDEYYPLASVQQMYAQLRCETKELVEFDAPHGNPWWMGRASQWFREHLR